ncbi:fimbrin-1 [Anaeramoeba flamelloides]|uniref:Fimbrin-1 n=1 Tax=Anaeramoeba flamelloides TaxID=1746091 RepID=A0AAV7YFH9_9EUKA|nr:fimbrin-1 [Anaeramoeba flamelloides]
MSNSQEEIESQSETNTSDEEKYENEEDNTEAVEQEDLEEIEQLISNGSQKEIKDYMVSLVVSTKKIEKNLMDVATKGLELFKEKNSLITQVEQLQEESKESQSQTDFLQNVINRLEDDNSNLEKKNEYMRQKIEEAWSTNQNFIDELSGKDEEVHKLRIQLENENTLNYEIENLKNQINENKKDKEKLKIFKDKESVLHKQVSTLKKEKEKLHKSNKFSLKQQNYLREQLDTKIDENKLLKNKFDNIKNLEKELEEFRIHNSWLEKLSLENLTSYQFINDLSIRFIENVESNINENAKGKGNENENEKNQENEKEKEERLEFDKFLNQNLLVEDSNMAIHYIKDMVKTITGKMNRSKRKEQTLEKTMSNNELNENENENKTENEVEIDITKFNFLELVDSNDKRRVVYLSLLLLLQYYFTRLEKKLKRIKFQKKELKEEVSEYKNKYELEQDKVNKITKRLEASQNDLNNLSKGNTEFQELKKQLESEIEESTLRENELKKQLEEIKSTQKQVTEELKEKIEKQKEEFNKEKMNWQKKKLSFEKELLELKQTNEKSIKELNEELDEKKKQYEKEIKELKDEFNTTKEELINQHENEIEELNFKLEGTEMNLEETQNNYKRIKDDLNKKTKQFENKIKKMENDYQNKNRFQQDQISLIKKQKTEIEEQLSTEEGLRKKYEKQKREAETKLQILENKLSGLKTNNENLGEKNNKLQLLVKQLEDEIKNLREQLEEALAQEIIITKTEIKESKNTRPAREVDLFERMLSHWINNQLKFDRDLNHLLPIGTKSPDLVFAIKDGLLLCKLINSCVPETIDVRVINTFDEEIDFDSDRESVLENHTLCINSALAIGCSIKGIKPTSLIDEEEIPCIQLTWEIIKQGLLARVNLKDHPELAELTLMDKETMETLSKSTPEELIIKWFNYHLSSAGNQTKVTNFADSMKDPMLVAVLLNQLSPKRCPIEPIIHEEDPDSRNEMIVKNAERLNVKDFISTDTLNSNNEKLNLAFLANLLQIRSGIIPKTKEIKTSSLPEFGTREERSFRNWINSLGVNPKVNNLYEDLKDGVILLQVIDFVQPKTVNWKRVTMNCTNPFQKVGNCNYVVELGKQLKLKLLTTGGEDIIQGKKVMLLGYVWQLMRFHVMEILKKLKVLKGTRVDDSSMVKWGNAKVTNSGKNSSIKSFRDKGLSSGLFIIDLIYSINTRAVNYNYVSDGNSNEEKLNNARYAISLTRKLGGTVFLLPEDIIEVKDKMILTLVGELMRIDRVLKSKN